MTDTANITESEASFHADGAAMNALAMLGNRMTGLGQKGRDKYLDHQIELDFTPLTRPELQALYRKSKICEKVVDLLPKAATANNWLEVTIGKGRKGIPAKAVQYSEDLKLRSAVREAGIMGRLDGDGFVLLGVDDGGQPWEPVNEGRIRRISWVYPVDRWRITPDTTTGRPGHPEYYSLYLPFTEALPDQQTNGKVHRSRVLRFPGKKLWGEMITYNTGYNDSVLQTFFQSFVRYLIAIEYSTRMVQDYNVFTYKLQGLAQLILAGDEEKIFHRFQAILTSLSSLGGLAMDADKEDAQFISRNFSGLDALIDRLKDDTSAAAAMPPTQLWGSSQKAALSNSSEGDKYAWADCVSDYRSEVFEEPIEDFFRLVFLAQNGPTGGRLPESWGISYRSALRLNLKEQTALRKDQTMGVDVPSITAGILLKEEVRESAWSGSEYTIERQLQPDLYAKQQAEAEAEQEPEPDEGEGEQGAGGAEGDSPTTKTRADDATPAKRIIDWQGYKLGLQYQPFDTRHGKVLPVAYGHIQKTKGADGMAVDCYVGANLESDRLWEITQLIDGQFDEHKLMIGFDSEEHATQTYLKLMPLEMFGGIRELSLSALANYRTDGEVLNRLDDWHEDAMFYTWHEDANGVPCGKGWIRAGHKCSKGISPHHASANPNHAGHIGYQGALAAASGDHTHPASSPDHPDHAAYKAGFTVHGGKGEIKPKAGGKGEGNGGGAKATPKAKAAPKAKAVNTPSKADAIKAADDFLAATSYADAKAEGMGGLHQRIVEANKEVKAGGFAQRNPEEQADFFGFMVNNGAHHTSGDGGFGGVASVQQQHLYNSLSEKQKNALAEHVSSHPSTGNWIITNTKNPRIKAISEDAQKRIDKLTAKAQAAQKAKQAKINKTKPPDDDLDDLFSMLDALDAKEVGDATSPFVPTGGTSHTDAVNPILTILERADKHLSGLEDSAIERVNSALESAYQDLEATILKSYSQETPGSLMARDRAAVLLSQVTDLLTLLNTRNADDIQQAFEDLLRGADAQGVTLAQDLTRAIANQHLQATANVPIEAIRNQATEGMTRLRNHTEAFADKASTIVTQGLIQGFSTDKVASLLQRELGVVRHKAVAIARTESLSASNRATEQTYQANQISYVQLMSTADDRTCPYCCARTMNVYELGKISVPLHVCCRCYLLPWSRTWQQLGLTNDDWAAKFKASVLAELTTQGLEPNHGLAPFEKANGLEAPVAVWEPGQHLDSPE